MTETSDMTTEHPQEWKKYVFMMSKHKLMERLQEFCKDDYPSSSDYKTVKEVSEALYYIMCCQKAMMAR